MQEIEEHFKMIKEQKNLEEKTTIKVKQVRGSASFQSVQRKRKHNHNVINPCVGHYEPKFN